ncbi:methylamine utilization protein [Chitinimonas sp.]|uniref:methylamine utilization protein n=1 Tax=Chitinimonas sp. TaxID=1934313 RepID=UPI002F92CA37
MRVFGWCEPLGGCGALLVGLLVPSAVAANLEVTVQDSGGQPLAEVVAYAEPVGTKPPKGKLVGSIDQVNKEFVPLVSVVQVGSAVNFPNKDNIRHSLYSFSPAKRFELKLYSGTPAAPVVFDKEGQVVLGCNIHDWMVGFLLVVDTPWFAKTDGKGQLVLADLTNGDYELKVWHPYQVAPAASQKVKVAAGGETHFTFRLKLAPPPPRQPGNY